MRRSSPLLKDSLTLCRSFPIHLDSHVRHYSHLLWIHCKSRSDAGLQCSIGQHSSLLLSSWIVSESSFQALRVALCHSFPFRLVSLVPQFSLLILDSLIFSHFSSLNLVSLALIHSFPLLLDCSYEALLTSLIGQHRSMSVRQSRDRSSFL